MKRLNIEIPDDLHQKIKVKAAQRNITVRLWLSRLIIKTLNQEESYEKNSNHTNEIAPKHGPQD